MVSYLEHKSGLASITKSMRYLLFFPNNTGDFSMRGYLGKSKMAGKGLYWAHQLNQPKQKAVENYAKENQI